MSSTGIFWIREDFRIENNPALSFATQNHDSVIALYIYNNSDFDNKREAQKWWVFKSLETLKKELSDYKINLEIVKGDELEIFSKFNKKDKLSKLELALRKNLKKRKSFQKKLKNKKNK